jgi:3-oxoacyl-[acyl-carrier-protein] synthase-3
MMRAVVTGCGGYVPERVLTNADLEATIDTDDAWIRERTGITQRHIAAEGQYTSDLAARAAREALAAAGIAPEQIDLVILATATPDDTFPGTATKVQHLLGCGHAPAFDLQAACSGFVYALSVADGMIRSQQAQRVLVLGAETMSRVVDWQDRRTCILFGDGAGAVVLEARAEPELNPRGILACHLAAEGAYHRILHTTGGISSTRAAGYLTMEGQEVFRHAVSKMVESTLAALDKAGLSVQDVDWLVPHQANARILSYCARKMEVPEEKLILTVDQHANTSSASIPLALADAARRGVLKPGDIIAMPALGAGLTWGTCIIRW